MKVWRLDFADSHSSAKAHLGERLYDRYRLKDPSLAVVQIGEQKVAVTELSLGGMSILCRRKHADELLLAERCRAQFKALGTTLDFTFDVLNQRGGDPDVVEIGCRFTYDESRLLDVLRTGIRFLELGRLTAEQDPIHYDTDLKMQLGEIDRVDYAAEFCRSNHGYSLVFSDFNTQFAIQKFDAATSLWSNIGPSGERCVFRQVQDTYIYTKAQWVMQGMGFSEEGPE